MNLKFVPFDIVSELDTDEAVAEYLRQVFTDGGSDEIIRALGHVARARGMTRVATDSGLGRENLYNALKPGAKPRFDTILRVCRALGVDLVTQSHRDRTAA
jgi:probable addiction module antidote protein